MGKHRIGVGFLLLVFGLLGTGPLLTTLVQHNLTRALTAQARVAEGVELKMAPLHLGDLWHGRVGAVDFTAARLGFAQGPVFTNVVLQSKGGRFDPAALLGRGELILRELAETHLWLELTAEELTALMRRDLPELEPTVYLQEGRVELEGFFDLFGQERLPFRAGAALEKATDRSLRLVPLSLTVAGVSLWAELFAQYAPQISWEFPLAIPWPVRLERFTVRPGVIQMAWREEARR
ncbi:MAG: hypothetical protein GX073_10520 [Firmicutes bacterium]|nr:hypothetical protein [Bacillota bacterium]